ALGDRSVADGNGRWGKRPVAVIDRDQQGIGPVGASPVEATIAIEVAQDGGRTRPRTHPRGEIAVAVTQISARPSSEIERAIAIDIAGGAPRRNGLPRLERAIAVAQKKARAPVVIERNQIKP